MMHHIDSGDARLLDEVLSQNLRGLLAEIAHADDRAFREQLRLRYEKLEALRLRLIAPVDPPTVTLDPLLRSPGH